jgi:hypothetical protein
LSKEEKQLTLDTVANINNGRKPIVFGIGSGIRTTLYSYFIKYDVAVGWDNNVWSPVSHYFSVGKDF